MADVSGRRLAMELIIGSVIAAGCGLDESDVAVVAQRSDRTVTATVTPTPSDDSTPSDVPIGESSPGRQDSVEDAATTSTPPVTDELLDELQESGFCDPVDVEDEGTVTAMHFVVQGVPQAPCYAEPPGEQDARLLDAWELLTAITPNELVDDISLLAGYEGCSGCDTLAFVAALDDEASFFLLAVDVVAGADDPDELRLTMMHELTHVFAQEPGVQLIVQDDAPDCATYFNGAGCFTDSSYMWAWIQEFWSSDELAGLPADGSPDDERDAERRCRMDPGYIGPYAAVHPEEDFAETFSAYVYDVEADPALQEKLAFFDGYPEFVAIRENARALELSGTESNFGGCGS